jgi:glycosyltransferase involved in cell wall biosynthesis
MDKKLKALVIAPQPFFTPRGTPFSVYYRTLVMAEKNIEIDLLTYGEGRDVEISGVRIIRIPKVRWLGEIKIGPSFAKLVLDLLMIVWTFSQLIRRRYDFVHAHEEAVFFCLLFKPIFGFKLIYDMHSSLPQQLSNFAFTKSGLLIRLFTMLEDASLRTCDVVITICPDLSDYVRGRIRDLGKHFLVENSIFDPVRIANNTSTAQGSIPAVKPTECRKQASLSPAGKRIILYAGTLESYQGIDILVQACALLKDTEPDAFLLVVGGSPVQVQMYRDMTKRLGVESVVTFTGQVPQTDAQEFTVNAEVLVSPRVKGTNTPLKIYQQLASGKPLVATRIYSHTQVLSDDVAFLVDATAEGLAAGIEQALADRAGSAARAARAVDLYHRRYARAIYEYKIDQILSRLILVEKRINNTVAGELL